VNPQAYVEMFQTENEHWWFVARRIILSDLLFRLKIPKCADILEVGCGTGGNLNMLSQFGVVYGLELDPWALQLAKLRSKDFNYLALGKCPNDIPFANKYFDLILNLDYDI
jgi:SAM-dependent methyltransferase